MNACVRAFYTWCAFIHIVMGWGRGRDGQGAERGEGTRDEGGDGQSERGEEERMTRERGDVGERGREGW